MLKVSKATFKSDAFVKTCEKKNCKEYYVTILLFWTTQNSV